MGKAFRLEFFHFFFMLFTLARAVNTTRNFLRLGSIINSSKIHFDMHTEQNKTNWKVRFYIQTQTVPSFNKNQAYSMYLFEMRLLCDCVTVTILLQVHENAICVYFSYRVAF